jgi:hypothetical protein
MGQGQGLELEMGSWSAGSTYSSHGQCARERARHVVVFLGLLWLSVGHDCRRVRVRHVIKWLWGWMYCAAEPL